LAGVVLAALTVVVVTPQVLAQGRGEAEAGASLETPAKLTLVEHSKQLSRPPAGTLMTVGYVPMEKEKPFFEKLSKEEKNPEKAYKDYSMADKVGTYVGWFGIARKIEENSEAKETMLLVEMKYFDGVTDSHMQVVSFFGGGDFEAVLAGVGHGIKHLSLIRVYGNVVREEKSIPEVRADYVRAWDWGRFTFMTYGKQKGNAEWQKLNKIDLSDIVNDMYDAFPRTRYYVDRLGRRELRPKAVKGRE